jgi:hypothetical protein
VAFLTQTLKRVAHHWRVKLFVQNTIGLIPGKAGFKLNEILTQFVRGGIEDREDLAARFLKGIDNLRLIRSKIDDFGLDDKTILELGTGWHGVDPVIFHLIGASDIVTVDHHPHLTHDNLKATIKALFENPDLLALIQDMGAAPDRISTLKESADRTSSLPELLRCLSVDYRIVTSSEYAQLTFEKPIDFFYSESVIHRVPADHLEDLFRVVGNRLGDGAVIFHRTDQSDINAQSHVDTELWALDFLRHREWVYNHFYSSRFNSQNRLRESDFLRLLDASGMSPVYVDSYLLRSDVDKLANFDVAPRFSDKTLDDLAVRHSKMICRKIDAPQSVGMRRNVIYLGE